MIEILSYDFMQRALFGGVIIGFIAPLIGIFIVLRRMSLIGDSLSHVALSGVALSAFIGINPLIGAVVFCVLGSLGIQNLRENYGKFEEVSLAVVMSGGIALAVVLMGLSKNIGISFMSYLFGSIGSISSFDIIVMCILAGIILIFLRIYFNKLFYISFDEETAKVSGIEVDLINNIFMILISFMIVISMRIVGILLISSLVVIPVAAAMQVSKSFKNTLILSCVFGEISVLCGIILSYYFDLASGGIIVLISIFILLCCVMYKNISSIKIKVSRKAISVANDLVRR
ncbi:metal ABC transporter permease [Alkalithermobacter paradoxus]|uniref:High-affinity zinc uptake system membrane protein ZnuB n=1 Tax=Alkalithermobacter paradoxus TaxID=29349 RepID=A0A1V4I8P3_9FIRM|nr:high-affinity zinc uptake system membrane protein ZnuB [[Clostridium] thermoalcaliphilum]